jgi:Lrp/AsnC family leucine-responsive transcriptional regulator
LQEDAVRRLDEIDLHLLQELQRDSSRTNVQLARAVGLSPPACLRRVRRLRQMGAIRGEMAVLDARLAGPGLTVVVLVELTCTRTTLAAFRQRIDAEPSVAHCWYVTGQEDFVVVIHAPDMTTFDATARRLFSDHPEVKRFVSLVVLEEVKRELGIPLRALSA